MTKNLVLALAVVGMTTLVGCGGDKPKTEASKKVAASYDPATAGTISGKVSFEGSAPKRGTLRMGTDVFCTKAHSTAVLDEELIVSGANELKNAVIRVLDENGTLVYESNETKTSLLDQVGCMYTPHVIAVTNEQPLTIRNSDATLHNVHATGTGKGASFNEAQATAGDEMTKTFSTPEYIKFKCDVHPWMSAYVAVVDNPYVSISDETGSFTISGVPAGEYTIEAWHAKLGTQTAKLTVTAQSATSQNFTFKL